MTAKQKDETNSYAEEFTNAQLVQAIRRVVKSKGRKSDLITHLNLEPGEASKKMVYARVQELKEAGVDIPNFKTLATGTKEKVSADDVAKFNELLTG